ncbi:hypothetical protein Leryth_020893 [Lithospermum erythrorhizon]|nr:hypothetical protein Leryth_020893 [Lithospermum erythrorhizon]
MNSQHKSGVKRRRTRCQAWNRVHLVPSIGVIQQNTHTSSAIADESGLGASAESKGPGAPTGAGGLIRPGVGAGESALPFFFPAEGVGASAGGDETVGAVAASGVGAGGELTGTAAGGGELTGSAAGGGELTGAAVEVGGVAGGTETAAVGAAVGAGEDNEDLGLVQARWSFSSRAAG